MKKTDKYFDYSLKVGKGWSTVTREFGHVDNTLAWLSGEVFTPKGIVQVYAEEGLTSLRFVWDDVCYDRNWEHEFGKRTITRLANEFVNEITQSAQQSMEPTE